MNVGVLLSNLTPEAGGGFTFETEVFESLVRLSGESQHTFKVFVRKGRVAKGPGSDRLRVIPISPARRHLERLRAGVRHLARFASKRGRRELREGRKANWMETLLLRSGVDAMWYPSPSVAAFEIPYITVVWDLQHRLQPFFPEVSAWQEWQRRERTYATVLRRAAYVITGNQVGKREIERFYQVAPERIRMLPHPTPRFALEPLSCDPRQVLAKFNIPAGYLFYPAQFWPHKNHVGLLQAAKLLKEQYGIPFPVVLVGSDKGNLSHLKKLVAQWGLADAVHFLGFVSRQELAALYRNAFATTYVTYFGPENLPPLEAFAAGCPVVASRVAGSEEQLGDAALLVDPSNPQEIAQAVRSLYHDPALRQTLVRRGEDRASRFGGDDFVRGVFEILDEFGPVRACWGPSAA